MTATMKPELRQTQPGGKGRPQQWVVIVDGREVGLIERWKGGDTMPDGDRWRRTWLNTIQSCYGIEASRFLEPAIEGGGSLFDFNKRLIDLMLARLGIATPMVISSDLGTNGEKTAGIIGLCNSVGADCYLSGIGGKNYISEEMMTEAGIRLVYNEFVHPVYKQRFEPFIPCMSALDWIFTQGDKLPW